MQATMRSSWVLWLPCAVASTEQSPGVPHPGTISPVDKARSLGSVFGALVGAALIGGCLQVPPSGGSGDASVGGGVGDGDSDSAEPRVDAGPPPESDCPLSPLVDDFEDGSYAEPWPKAWADPGVDIDETDGRGIIAVSGTQPAYGGFASDRFDARNTCTYVEVVSMLNHAPGTSAEMFLMLKDTEEAIVFFKQVGGNLSCGYEFSNNNNETIDGSYDPEQHRWFRLRIDGTTAYCGVSADRISWDEITILDVPVNLSSALFVVMAGTNEVEEEPGQVEIDNVNR